MDLKDDDLGRLAKLNENGQLPDLINQMERMKELEDEKTSHFNFCLRIGKSIENEIRKALDEAKATKGMPTAIVAHTVKGKGVSFMENEAGWHGNAPNDEQYAIAMKELGESI